jgi:hypothetical protein
MTATSSTALDYDNGGLLYKGLRIFGYLMLALMVASIAYSAWIAITNWGAIGV